MAGSDVGILARAWQARSGTFKDVGSLIERPQQGAPAPGTAFNAFALAYWSLLSRRQIHGFAMDYLDGAFRLR